MATSDADPQSAEQDPDRPFPSGGIQQPLQGQSIEPKTGNLRVEGAPTPPLSRPPSPPPPPPGTLRPLDKRFTVSGAESSAERVSAKESSASGLRHRLGQMEANEASDQLSAVVSTLAEQREGNAQATQAGVDIRSSTGTASGAASASATAFAGGTNPVHGDPTDPTATTSVPVFAIFQDNVRTEDVAERDALSRERTAKALAQLLDKRQDDKPLTIALFGPWGAGKSTLIGIVRQELTKSSKRFEFADFNAWKNERVDNMGAALAQSVVDTLIGDLGYWSQLGIALKISARRKARLRKSLQQSAGAAVVRVKMFALTYVVPFGWPISLLAITVALAGFSLSVPLSDPLRWLMTSLGGLATVAMAWASAHAVIFKGLLESFKTVAKDQKLADRLLLPDYSEKLGSAYEIGRTLDDLCDLTLRGKSSVEKQLFVVVDDLDRCSPAAIKQVFDAVRLVAHIRGVSVIVALDDRIAYAAVAKFYSEFEILDREPSQVSRDYLAKVFNVTVMLQDAGFDAVENYIRSHIFEGSAPTAGPTASGSSTSPPSVSDENENTMEALPFEVDVFVELAKEFSFTNPRELWRLRQTWSLLKGIALPSSAPRPIVRVWMRHMFLRERILQGTNEQRKQAADFLRSFGSPAPSLDGLVPNFERISRDLAFGFQDRDAMILGVLLPAAPAELVKHQPAPTSK